METDMKGNGAPPGMAAARQTARTRAMMEPDEGESPASIDDLTVTRDPETGKIEPLTKKTPWNGLVVSFVPLTYRDQMKYGLDDRGLIEMGDDERLEFLREHITEPDLSELESLEELRYSVVEDLLMVVAAHSRDRRWAEMPEPVEDEETGKA